MSRDSKLAHNHKGLGPDKIKQVESLKESGALTNGYACSELIEPVPVYRRAPCEVVNFDTTGEGASKNNCWIILGRDRATEPETGYGGRGDTQAGAIYICAGMNSAKPYEVLNPDAVELDLNNYPKNPSSAIESLEYSPTSRSPDKDASIIYLSQKTSIDEMFNLGGCSMEDHWNPDNYDTTGWSSSPSAKINLANLMSISKHHVPQASKPHAAIAIKSDNVRIIGRESIRIQVQEQETALGSDKGNSYGIALVGGGQPELAQPAVLGYNLVSSYRHLKEALLVLKKAVSLFMKQQMSINMIIAQHEHANGPLGVTDLLTPFAMAIENANFVTEGLVKLNLNSFTARMGTFASDYTEPGDKYILSENVFHD